MTWYQQQLSVFPPMITSAIPPKPFFSLLTNISQVTFPICFKSDSLAGVSVGELDNSRCGVAFSCRTDGENQDLETALGYYDLAQRLGARGSGRTDLLQLFPGMRLSSDAIAAAAAKSLQSCPTLCDPIDGSPPGSPIPGILQARTLEWVATSFSNA